MAILLYFILFFIILFPPGIRYTLGDWAYGTPQSAELNDWLVKTILGNIITYIFCAMQWSPLYLWIFT